MERSARQLIESAHTKVGRTSNICRSPSISIVVITHIDLLTNKENENEKKEKQWQELIYFMFHYWCALCDMCHTSSAKPVETHTIAAWLLRFDFNGKIITRNKYISWNVELFAVSRVLERARQWMEIKYLPAALNLNKSESEPMSAAM